MPSDDIVEERRIHFRIKDLVIQFDIVYFLISNIIDD